MILFASECIKDIPVSFQRVWYDVWEKAIAECNIKKFANCDCGEFGVNELPDVPEELAAVYDWVGVNGGGNTDYIRGRIEELKEYFGEFYSEHKGDREYWFVFG
ncbi:MAG: hypothetical protein NC078_02690 [Ruminococcus sp.]|nr:hypothetical protein [Ruminococcus sp.]